MPERSDEMDRRKILIIDDEDDFCNIVKENLELRGSYEVYTTTSGKEGLKLAKKVKPDLILLDIRMPEMDGFQVLERLKKEKDTMVIPVIMLSALDDDSSKVKGSQLYNEMYLTKPIKIVDLISSIEEVLKRRGAL